MEVTSQETLWHCVAAQLLSSSGVHVLIRAPNALVSSSTSDDPHLVNIDCTGLGGHDLGGFKDYDICIRTDKHGQSIYGPSVTPLESPGRDGVHHVSLVALGGSKAMHEFLVLHYMATDSAEEWDTFLDLCLPQCSWVRAGSRRALAMHMYNKCHVAPSHRRLAHPSWIAGMKNALLITYLLKSMSVVSQLVLTAAFAFFTFCGTCLMSKWGVFWEALLFLRHCYMGSSPTTVPGSW